MNEQHHHKSRTLFATLAGRPNADQPLFGTNYRPTRASTPFESGSTSDHEQSLNRMGDCLHDKRNGVIWNSPYHLLNPPQYDHTHGKVLSFLLCQTLPLTEHWAELRSPTTRTFLIFLNRRSFLIFIDPFLTRASHSSIESSLQPPDDSHRCVGRSRLIRVHG